MLNPAPTAAPTASATPAPPGSARAQPRDRSSDDEVALVEHYRDLVSRIAGQIHRRSPPCVQRDDLLAAGMSGLWDALRRRKERPEESFDYYVCRRVRGAIIDELRAEDWLPRRRAEGAAGRVNPTVVHFEDLGQRDQSRVHLGNDVDSEQLVDRKQAVERVRAGLDRLPKRERYVLTMRDLGGMAIKDLGNELGVSKPRVCQIRTQALKRLREYLDAAA